MANRSKAEAVVRNGPPLRSGRDSGRLAVAVDRLDVGGENEPRVLRFVLPYPPRALFPNARVNRRWQHQPKVIYAGFVATCLRVTLGPPPWPRMERARLDITAVYPNRRGIADSDGLVAACKTLRDQLCDWRGKIEGIATERIGILPDDSPRHLVMGTVDYAVDRAEKERSLLVTLTELRASPTPAAVAGRRGG